MMVTMPGVRMCGGRVASTRALVTPELSIMGTPQGALHMVTRHMARLQMSAAGVSLVSSPPSRVMVES